MSCSVDPRSLVRCRAGRDNHPRSKCFPVIYPREAQTAADVAGHYDELDPFYREIWGDHVHHGYWVTGQETLQEAVEGLVDLVASRLALTPGERVCDVGCGYGATAELLTAH